MVHTAFSQASSAFAQISVSAERDPGWMCTPGRRVAASGRQLTFTLVCRVGSQGIAEKALFAAVTVEAGRVVDALETLPRQAVAVAHGVGVYVVVALAWAAQSHGPIAAQRVSKVAVIAELTPLAWE